jgi:TRAP-type mannitol/chloroaromatic compound transport system permease small subunit
VATIAAAAMQRLIFFADQLSTFVGKAFAWLIGGLMVLVCAEVLKRYILNQPSAWVFDVSSMLYCGAFIMCGAYTLAQGAHVRGDFLYGSMRPRLQAALDLALYLVFFVPGILALVFAGWEYAADSWRIGERSSITAEGPPVYHFKALIPIAGALVLAQGIAEILRCIVCLKAGRWPARLKDAEETDVVEEQLALSTHVDEEAKREVIAGIEAIDEAAHQRLRGDKT